MEAAMENLFDLNEAIEYIGKPSKSTVRDWMRKGLVPFVRLPGGRLIRFRQEDLDALILAGLVNARQDKEGKV